ncbi:YceI family protein [Winogradskyella endarachnes]|uniref:YceI family protein n=1 Tax=Winogradskyella endarachnes TaxID=2681965 RepID=A0A6L6U7L1_9FLAO|nr:YceI family protein [Winogradskyella endarachnes]MUU77586.1 YceI family protein [Winogradskyella endarachnes]
MKHSIKFPAFFILVIISGLFSTQITYSQNFTLSNSNSVLEVHGTSSLHDWHLDTEKQSGKLVISNTEDLTIESLSVSIEAESLKSGKSSMDNNTYEALKTDDYKTMDYKLTSVSKVDKLTDTSFKVTVVGDMTIAGVTKSLTMIVSVKIDGSKVSLEGEKSFKMTDFGVDPPKALLGTIKTGDEIKIIFKSVFNKN